jgi:hypothetical protein
VQVARSVIQEYCYFLQQEGEHLAHTKQETLDSLTRAQTVLTRVDEKKIIDITSRLGKGEKAAGDAIESLERAA